MTPAKAFNDQKRHAESREIPFLFTYTEWLEMWLVSGKWHLRGKEKGNFQMCRYNDEGSYTPNNCYIGTVEQNQDDKACISNEKVNSIVCRYLNSKLSQYEIAKEFNVTQSYVSRLVNKKRRAYAQNNSTSY